jgi:hypothetical protein
MKLQLGKNIRNVSGATLSCKHVTDGVNRLLATYDLVFNNPIQVIEAFPALAGNAGEHSCSWHG